MTFVKLGNYENLYYINITLIHMNTHYIPALQHGNLRGQQSLKDLYLT